MQVVHSPQNLTGPALHHSPTNHLHLANETFGPETGVGGEVDEDRGRERERHGKYPRFDEWNIFS